MLGVKNTSESPKKKAKTKKKYVKVEPVMLAESMVSVDDNDDMVKQNKNMMQESGLIFGTNTDWGVFAPQPIISPMLNPLKKRKSYNELESPLINVGFKQLDESKLIYILLYNFFRAKYRVRHGVLKKQKEFSVDSRRCKSEIVHGYDEQ